MTEKPIDKMTDEEIEADGRLQIGVTVERFYRHLLTPYQGGTGEYKNALGPLSDATAILDWLNKALPRLVHDARHGGASWDQVGHSLGVSRQSAWERFGPGQAAALERSRTIPRTHCPVCGLEVAQTALSQHMRKYHPD